MKPAIGIYLSIILMCVYCIYMFSMALGPTLSFSDYRAQYTGALMIRKGVRSDLYSIDTQYNIQKKLFPNLQKKQLLPFLSPPAVAFILFPLSLFSYGQGYVVFGVALLFILFLTSFFACRAVLISRKVQKLLYINQIDLLVIISAMLPLWLSALGGQLSIIWTLAFLISYLLAKQNKHVLSGLTLSIICMKPHLLIVPLVFLVIQKRWKMLVGVLIGGVFLALFSLYLVGWQGMVGYLQLLSHVSKNGASNGVEIVAQPTLRGLLHSFLEAYLSMRVIDIIWIMGAGLVFCLVYKHWKKADKPNLFDLQWALMIVVTCFTSAHTHYHDLSLLLVPLIIILNYWFYVLDKKNIIHRELFRYSKVMAILVVLVCSEGLLSVKIFVLIFYSITIIYLLNQIKENKNGAKPQVDETASV